jgi:cyclase
MFYGAGPDLFAKAEENRLNPTESEARLWGALRKSQLGLRFKRQHPIDRFIVDFYCHKLRLVIEVDGEYYAP